MDLSGDGILSMMEGNTSGQVNEPKVQKSERKSTLPKHISGDDVERMFSGSKSESSLPDTGAREVPQKPVRRTKTSRDDLRKKFSKRLEKWRPTK
jgi:hypothetical protein